MIVIDINFFSSIPHQDNFDIANFFTICSSCQCKIILISLLLGINYLLSESELVTGKSQTDEALPH